jgi:hypothetical protein
MVSKTGMPAPHCERTPDKLCQQVLNSQFPGMDGILYTKMQKTSPTKYANGLSQNGV